MYVYKEAPVLFMYKFTRRHIAVSPSVYFPPRNPCVYIYIYTWIYIHSKHIYAYNTHETHKELYVYVSNVQCHEYFHNLRILNRNICDHAMGCKHVNILYTAQREDIELMYLLIAVDG